MGTQGGGGGDMGTPPGLKDGVRGASRSWGAGGVTWSWWQLVGTWGGQWERCGGTDLLGDMGSPVWGHLYGDTFMGHGDTPKDWGWGVGGHHMLMVVFIATQGHGHPWGPPWGHGDLLRDILGDIKDLGTWTSLGTSFRTWTSLGTQGLGDIRTSLGTWGPPWGHLGTFGAMGTSLGTRTFLGS